MFGRGVHWRVIFGVRAAAAGKTVGITVFDPLGGHYSVEAWSPAASDDYYIVG